jgi:hypothetical protein
MSDGASPAREDAVLWRSPTCAREWLRAAWRAWSRSIVAVLGVGVGIAVGSGYTMTYYLQQSDPVSQTVEPASDLVAYGLATLFLVILVGAPALAMTLIGALFVPRLTLTANEFRAAPRFPWRRLTIVPRTEIRSVEIFEGGGAIVLRGDTGEILRARQIERPAAFAETLAVPTVAWPAREPSRPAVWLGAGAGVTVLVSWFVAMAAYLVFLNIIGNGALGFLTVTLAALLAGTITAPPLALSLVLAAGRRFASPATLEEFTWMLRDNGPWQGFDAKGGWIHKPLSAYMRLAARIAGIVPPPPLQPELRHGMTPEMAAAIEGAT